MAKNDDGVPIEPDQPEASDVQPTSSESSAEHDAQTHSDGTTNSDGTRSPDGAAFAAASLGELPRNELPAPSSSFAQSAPGPRRSRKPWLIAGAAAGGALVLGLTFAGGFAANALIDHGPEDGPGHGMMQPGGERPGLGHGDRDGRDGGEHRDGPQRDHDGDGDELSEPGAPATPLQPAAPSPSATP